MTAHRLIRIAGLFACVAGTMMSAAYDGARPSPVGPSSSSSNSSWELSGVAIGEDGRRIQNAQLWVNVGGPALVARTDEMGLTTGIR